MAVWPEERLRERVEAAGGRARVDADALLQLFSVRKPTAQAGINVRQWLEHVGVTMEPWALPPGGEVTLSVADHGSTAAGASPAGAISPSDLEETRRASVLAYCSRLCDPERIAEAADAAFSGLRATVDASVSAGAMVDLDRALLESTRSAAAERASAAEPPSRVARIVSSRSGTTCDLMPRLLAGRASGRLGGSDGAAVERHLSRCAACRGHQRRRDEAEQAYAALLHGPAPRLADLRAAPAGVEPAAEPEPAPVPEPVAHAEPAPVAATLAPPPPPGGTEEAEARPLPSSPWVRRIAIGAFVVGAFMATDALLTVTWKEPLSAFLNAREQNKLDDELAQEQRRRPVLSADEQAAIRQIRSAPERRERRLSSYATSFARHARDGHAVGRLRVEGLGEWVIVQGTNDADLRKAPGHYRETVMPGQRGTVAVAGHRTTYGAPFRRIDKLEAGDGITFTMPYGRFTYAVQGRKIVPAGSSDATKRVSYNRLVLTACHPLYSAKQRIVVFARLTKKEPLGIAAKDEGPLAPAADRRQSAATRTRQRRKALGRRLLGPGTKGRDVRALQRLLGVPRTGVYDPITEFAVKDFQSSHGLGADGRAGAATKRKLARRPRPPSRPPTPPPVAPVPPSRPGESGANGPGGQPGQFPQDGRGGSAPGQSGGGYRPSPGSGQ